MLILRSVNLSVLFTLCFTFSLSGCYEPNGGGLVYSGNSNWTGSGDYQVSGASGLAVGLTEQDMTLFYPDGRLRLFTNVLAGEFSGPYRLTSIAQTTSYGLHEHSFLHGNRVGRTDNLDLFHTEGAYFLPHTTHRVRPADELTIYAGGVNFRVVEICDMATPDSRSFTTRPHQDISHLYLSVRACSNTNFCVGGIVEADFNNETSFWWIKNSGGIQHSQMLRHNGAFFSNECMPLASTRWSANTTSNASQEYLYVADPSHDEITVFNAQNLRTGPFDVLIQPDAATITDISAEGMTVSGNHYNFLQVLWTRGATKSLKHYSIVNGIFPTSYFLDEWVPADVTKIQGFGQGRLGYTTGKGHLMIFGRYGELNAYKKSRL